jgi:hypothetical protein
MKANGKADDARALAEEVRIEWIEPELAKLRTRLNSAQKALRRKAYISAGITGISTLCGLKLGAGAGAAVGTGLGLLASGISRDTSKYYEEKEAIELSDMFFLWQALKHAA